MEKLEPYRFEDEKGRNPLALRCTGLKHVQGGPITATVSDGSTQFLVEVSYAVNTLRNSPRDTTVRSQSGRRLLEISGMPGLQAIPRIRAGWDQTFLLQCVQTLLVFPQPDDISTYFGGTELYSDDVTTEDYQLWYEKDQDVLRRMVEVCERAKSAIPIYFASDEF